MIVKDIDKKDNLTKFEKFGHAAEKQMAFYLKRAFKTDDKVSVLNDLRLEYDGEVAQIDHLIVHRFGFMIVESKSVTGKIIINEQGEWPRSYTKFSKGIPSPILQAQRQADFLRIFLDNHADELDFKQILFKASMKDFKFAVLVAISDDGIVERPAKATLDEVLKADQITNKINALIKKYAKEDTAIFSVKMLSFLKKATRERICQLLTKSHTPKQRAVTVIEAAQVSEVPAETAVEVIESESNASQVEEVVEIEQEKSLCLKCNSSAIQIHYGKFGYYFKCSDCEGNSKIKLTCRESSCKPKIRKKKQQFFKDCSSCESSEVFFENLG